MEIRKITQDERKKYHKISQYAFGNWQDKEVEDDKIKWMNSDECFVIIENGEMVSGLINHNLKQNVRGTVKKLSGIGNVATYPEYRNKGYVKKLMTATFDEMRLKKQSVSMLQPFKESFYQKLGYISTNREMKLKFHISGIQHYLGEIPDDWVVERKTGIEAHEEFLSYYSKAVLKWHGIVIYDEIHQGFKEHLAQNTIYILVKHNNVTKAACCYKKNDMKITIHDIIWTDLESRKLIFNYFARHRDQVGDFEMPIPMGTNFFSWFSDMRSQYELKMCEGPWMVRIVDVIDSFSYLKISGNGSLIFKVTDELCNWNSGNYKLAVKDGKTQMKRSGMNIPADVTCDIRGLTALLYGSLEIEEIIDRGWMETKTEDVRIKLQEWFPTLLLFNTFQF